MPLRERLAEMILKVLFVVIAGALLAAAMTDTPFAELVAGYWEVIAGFAFGWVACRMFWKE